MGVVKSLAMGVAESIQGILLIESSKNYARVFTHYDVYCGLEKNTVGLQNMIFACVPLSKEGRKHSMLDNAQFQCNDVLFLVKIEIKRTVSIETAFLLVSKPLSV